jgi:hypothetical protein
MSVVGDFYEKPWRRANGTVEDPRIAAYPETDRFPSSAQRIIAHEFSWPAPEPSLPRHLTPRRDPADSLSAAKRMDEPLAELRTFHMALYPARHRHRGIDGMCPKTFSTSSMFSPVTESHHFAAFWRGRFPVECDEELRPAACSGGSEPKEAPSEISRFRANRMASQ